MVRPTLHDLLDAAMHAQRPIEADTYLRVITVMIMSHSEKDGLPTLSIVEATKIAKDKLAYHAGYRDNETRARVEELFQCEHPIFGSIKKNGPPSPEEAFQLGVWLGKSLMQEKN
jgi:hypothetical protein